jgi:hypothetical protein
MGHLIMQGQLPFSGQPTRSTIRIQPDCDVIGVGQGTHRLMLSVSDRPYLDALSGQAVDPEAPLDSVPDGANRIRSIWILNCP